MVAIRERLVPQLSSLPELTFGYRRIAIALERTDDFKMDIDPWSVFFRKVIRILSRNHLFTNKEVTEFGVGDGRNLEIIIDDEGVPVKKLRGLDIAKDKIKKATSNLLNFISREQLELEEADVIDYLYNWREQLVAGNKKPLEGVAIMCLPQAPHLNGHEQTIADAYDLNGSRLKQFISEEWPPDWAHHMEQHGLTLNAAVMELLHDVTTEDFRLVLILSNRLPIEVRENMIQQCGWLIEEKYMTADSTPVQQDPDTVISWVSENGIDDGRRFFERIEIPDSDEVVYAPISAEVAETRRLLARKKAAEEELRTGQKVDARKFLNVYHHLSIYVVKRNGAVESQTGMFDQQRAA